MGRIFLVIILGAALFFAVIWQLGLLETPGAPGMAPDEPVADIKSLGDNLYRAADFPKIPRPTGVVEDPIVLYGVMNVIDQEDVASEVQGRILFIGEQVDESAVLASGSAAFVAEPFYSVNVEASRASFVKVYRRIYEGEHIKQGQMLALIDPAKALGELLAKSAKLELASAERDAAQAGEDEGKDRYDRAIILKRQRAISTEELGAARLTWLKLKSERIAKEQGVKVAQVEKGQAEDELKRHEIRALLPYRVSSIKSIVRQGGSTVKPTDPIIVVQNLDRLRAEALIEDQDYQHLKEKYRNKPIKGTIEPTILQRPLAELPGHNREVTSVAVSCDMKVVSGSEDKSVCVWCADVPVPEGNLVRKWHKAPKWKLKHEDVVRVVVCAPAKTDKNLCLAGCDNGDIYLWDLDGTMDQEPTILNKAHGENALITSLAISPDGKFFASGASDGSIRLWSARGAELYAFVPKHGIKQCHEDPVTSLHFTKQCRLVSAGRDKTLRVWQLKQKGAASDGDIVADRGGGVPQLGVSHDGKWMLFDQGNTLKLYSVETGTLTHTLSLPVNSTPFATLALFSPDDSLILTAGGPENRLQLWRAPDDETRGFEVMQFTTLGLQPVTCAAFSPAAGKGGPNSFAVSASGQKIYLWPIPTEQQVRKHRIMDVQMTLRTQTLDPGTRQSRVGFEVDNTDRQFEAGRPVTIVIE
jgi:WD40 repeat protein